MCPLNIKLDPNMLIMGIKIYLIQWPLKKNKKKHAPQYAPLMQKTQTLNLPPEYKYAPHYVPECTLQCTFV